MPQEAEENKKGAEQENYVGALGYSVCVALAGIHLINLARNLNK